MPDFSASNDSPASAGSVAAAPDGDGTTATRGLTLHCWRGAELGRGTSLGAVADAEGLRWTASVGTARRRGAEDDQLAVWVGPEVRETRGFTSLVPSWNAVTPGGSWLGVEARLHERYTGWSRWHSFGRWAERDDHVRRGSTPLRPGTGPGTAVVRIDELEAAPGRVWTAFQLRLVLARPAEPGPPPQVRLLAALTSYVPASPADSPDHSAGPASGRQRAPVRELPLPAYSQQRHRGERPERGGGGAAWCSPASVAMVLGYWSRGPGRVELAATAAPGCPHPAVDHAVEHVYDHVFGGAGNWSYNVAYAGRYGLEAFVTRLTSLVEAESFLGAGVPLIASLAFASSDLDGAGYDTEGHLLVIVGFDGQGNVVCHDPASHERPDDTAVRVVYAREQFERAWLGSTGGVVYVIHPAEVALPRPRGGPRW